MANKRINKREKIFSLYSENLKLFLHHSELVLSVDGTNPIDIPNEIYVCPLCLKVYGKPALDVHPPVLTLEHVPPKSVGGKEKVLTCKDCNNVHGETIDTTLKLSLETKEFLKMVDGSKIKARFTIQEKTTKGDMTHHGERGLIFRPEKTSNPHYYNSMTNYVTGEEPGEEKSIKFEIQTPNPKHLKRAILKTAFLEMFSLFGYAFIINNLNAHKLLDAINNPYSDIPIALVYSEQINKHIGISIIKEPKSLINYIITFPISFESKQDNISIIIPGYGESAWENYMSYFKQKGGGTFHLESINKFRGIADTQENLFQYFLLLSQSIPRYGPTIVHQPIA